MERVIGVSSGCFLFRGNGYVKPKPIPFELRKYQFELQVGRGYFFEDIENIVTVHLPFREYHAASINGEKLFIEGRNVNIATLNGSLRKAWLKEFTGIIFEAASRNASVAVLHYGVCDCQDENVLNESHRVRHWKAEASFLGEISKVCDDVGISLLVENHPYDETIFLNHLKHMEAVVEEGFAKICLDFPHAYYREFKGEDNIEALASALRDEILEVHLADGNGLSHEPLQVGEGSINFEKVLKKLTRTKFFIIEVRGDPTPSIKAARELLEKTTL
ncbi:MAG: sugar phosphate isomerase/epimerase [Candidatus Jordarchaeales archaeon]